jgi:hypothetical protein
MILCKLGNKPSLNSPEYNCLIYPIFNYTDTNLHLPETKLSLGKRTFRFSGSVLFNNLPAGIKKSTSLASFKKNVKEYFL